MFQLCYCFKKGYEKTFSVFCIDQLAFPVLQEGFVSTSKELSLQTPEASKELVLGFYSWEQSCEKTGAKPSNVSFALK